MLKNNLIALLDQTFPNVNKLFSSPVRKSDGHKKRVNFALKFWHCECVCGISDRQFKDKYERWCKRNGYYYRTNKAEDIYTETCGNVGLLPMCESTKILITQAIIQLQTIEETLAAIKREMQSLASYFGLACSSPHLVLLMRFIAPPVEPGGLGLQQKSLAFEQRRQDFFVELSQ